jgi:hypothetical protein
VALVQVTQCFGNGIGMLTGMLHLVADRLAIGPEVDHDVIAQNSVIDRLTGPQLDMETAGYRIVVEIRAYPVRSPSSKTV